MQIIARTNGGVITESQDVSFGYFTVNFVEKSEVISGYMELQENDSKNTISKTFYPFLQSCILEN